MTIAEPYTPEFFADPYPTLAHMRETEPVKRIRAFGFLDSWLVTSYDLGKQVLTDPRFRKALPGQPSPFAPPMAGPPVPTLDCDPPDHTRLRKLMVQGFTNHRVQAWRPRIQEFVDGLLDAMAAKDDVELIRDLAYPLPTMVICEILGVPEDERADVERRTKGLRRDSSMSWMEIMQRNMQATREMQEYFTGMLARKRESPGDDLTSALIAARDGEERLSETELHAMLMFLLFAGYVTTVNVLAGGIRTLLDHPDQLKLVVDSPELVGAAVEECLRYQSPFVSSCRVVGEDLEFAGVSMRRGESILVSINAANRDPETFPQPDRFDITRAANPHVAFGHGIHHCIGAPLARLEAEIAFTTLFRRFEVTARQAEAEWGSDGVVRGIAELPVDLTPRD